MANYEVRLLEGEESELWDRLVDESPQGTIYAKSHWFRLMEKVYGVNYRLIGCFSGTNLIGGIGIFHTSKFKRLIAYKPPLTPYAGLLIKRASKLDGAGEDGRLKYQGPVTEALIPWLEREYAYLKLVHHWSLQDIRTFAWSGWETGVNYTYTIPLGDEEQMWKNLDPKIVREVNKGISQGFEGFVGGEKEFGLFYNLLKLTFAKQNLPPPITADKYEDLISSLSDNQRRLYLVRDREGRIMAGRLTLVDRTGPHDWMAGSDPEFLKTGAMPFLYWHILKDLAADHRTFDLNGANIKSIAHFKRTMGGQLRPYYTTGVFNSSLLKSLKLVKEIPRIWS